MRDLRPAGKDLGEQSRQPMGKGGRRQGASDHGGEGRPKRGSGSDWSGAGSRRGRTPEMWTTEEPGEGEERRSPGGGKERRRKTTT